MRTLTIILLAVFLSPNSSIALDNFKKEKKALTETIKNEYDTWSLKTENVLIESDIAQKKINQNSFDANSNKASIKKEMSYKFKAPITQHKFEDFVFTIVNDQAIVQFSVDHQLVSAFLEKNNGKWKLVCAAKLDPTT